ncbi:MAG TPA: hypothetical protein VFI27_05640 [candidate division Zixibacteria bacterium]|nr:hypothetical protein [candidate division Zixibacteria bacterium]
MKTLDEKRPFGRVRGDPEIGYAQDGYKYDHSKRLVPGSGVSDPDTVATNNSLSDASKAFDLSTLHVSKLKKRMLVVYDRLDKAGTVYDQVAGGAGAKERIVEFLVKYE